MDKSQCFIDQYSKASIIDEKGKKYAIDGSVSVAYYFVYYNMTC